METSAKILIIEDDRLLVASVKDILAREGYQVDSADGASQAQPLLSTTHLALIDLRLPDKAGIEIFKELKQANPEAEAIIITGYADLHSAIEALNLGAFAYLEKPIRPDKLLLDIKRALERRSLILEIKRREHEIKGMAGFTGTILNERVRLLEEAMEKEKSLSALYRSITISLESPDPLKAGKELLPLIAEVTQANLVVFILGGQEGNMDERTHYFRDMKPFEIEIRPKGLRQEIFRTGKPLIIPDLRKQQSPPPNPSVLAAGLKSASAYPLEINGTIYAILILYSLKEDAFSQQEEAIGSLTGLCAIPLRHAAAHREADIASREWEATVSATQSRVAVVDRDRKIMKSNKAFDDMVGVSPEQMKGKTICELIHGKPDPIPGCLLERACQSGNAENIIVEEPFLRIKRLHVRIIPVKGPDGKVIRFVHLFRNLDLPR